LNNTTTISASLKCNQCGCELILQKTGIRNTQNCFFPTTVITYRCSNKSCQEEIDKKTVKRIELRHEQELARQKRLENMTNRKYNQPKTV